MIVFKNNNEESQKLFSTGNSELDDLLTEVYYSGIDDGYDYAQKEFAEKKDDDKATATGITIAGASGGALLGNRAANSRIRKAANKQIEEIEKTAKEKIAEAEKKYYRPGKLLNNGISKPGRKLVKEFKAEAAEATSRVQKAAEETIKKGNKRAKIIAGAGLTAAGLITAAGALKRKSSKRNEQAAK